MKIDCWCPNCGQSASITGRKPVAWVACRKCGHVFKLAESLETIRGGKRAEEPACPSRRGKRFVSPSSPHLGVRQ